MEFGIGMLLDADDLKQMLKEVGFSIALNGMMEHTAANIRMVQRILDASKKGFITIDPETCDLEELKKYVKWQVDSLYHLVDVLKPRDPEEEDNRKGCIGDIDEMRRDLLAAFGA